MFCGVEKRVAATQHLVFCALNLAPSPSLAVFQEKKPCSNVFSPRKLQKAQNGFGAKLRAFQKVAPSKASVAVRNDDKRSKAAVGIRSDAVRANAPPTWGGKQLTFSETLSMTEKLEKMSKKQREKFIKNAKQSGFLKDP